MKTFRLTVGLLVFSIFPVQTAICLEEKIPPQLVLFISIDQMRFDYLTRFEPLFDSGLRILLKKGAVFTEARFRHAVTETGPGHAVLLSGKHPSHTGIIANEWYDSRLKKWINVVHDEAHKPIGGKGRGASPNNFIGETIGDILKTKNAAAKVVSVSAKDRAAILLGGKKPDGVFWLGKEGDFITSTYYAESLPEWVKIFNSRSFLGDYKDKQWTHLHTETNLYDSQAGPDDFRGESDEFGRVFPHSILDGETRAEQLDSFMRTPFLDDIVIDFALKARKEYQLGEDANTDILAISLSATDKIGHNYGPHSHEMMDQILRLDRGLGHLLSTIDQSIGLEKTLVIVSADHGVLPLVEHLNDKGIFAERLHTDKLNEIVNAALTKHFPGRNELLLPSEAPHYWLNRNKINSYNLSPNDVQDVISKALMGTESFEGVFTNMTVTTENGHQTQILFNNSYFKGRSADIIGHGKENIIIDNDVLGTGHGSAHEYDRHVPIIFMGQSVKAGTYDSPCGPEDIVPTLAGILAIEFEKEEDSRVLGEIFSGSHPNPSKALETSF